MILFIVHHLSQQISRIGCVFVLERMKSCELLSAVGYAETCGRLLENINSWSQLIHQGKYLTDEERKPAILAASDMCILMDRLWETASPIISHLHTKSALLMKISCCPNIFLLLFGFSLRPTSPFGFSLRPTSQFGFSLRPTSQFGFSLRPTSPFGFSTSPHFFIWIFTSPHFSVWIFTSPHFSVWIFHFASLLHLDFHFAPLLSLDFPLCPTSLFGFSTSPHFSVWIFTSPHFSVWIFHFAPLLSLDFPLRPTSRRVGGELE